jgi:hypothetical protein
MPSPDVAAVVRATTDSSAVCTVAASGDGYHPGRELLGCSTVWVASDDPRNKVSLLKAFATGRSIAGHELPAGRRLRSARIGVLETCAGAGVAGLIGIRTTSQAGKTRSNVSTRDSFRPAVGQAGIPLRRWLTACLWPRAVAASECVIPDGTDGFLVARDNAADLAAKLQTVLRDSPGLNEAMGAARPRAARYAGEAAGKTFKELWGQLLTKVERH